MKKWYEELGRISDDELTYYQAQLMGRFAGDRYKVVVVIDTAVGKVNSSYVNVYDLHSADNLRVVGYGDESRYWMKPVAYVELTNRTDDGSPYATEAREKAEKLLDSYNEHWRGSQMSMNGYLCVDLVIVSPERIDQPYYYGILF